MRESEPTGLGDYLLLGEIARGGMGVVYQAVHVALNRPCALKVIRGGKQASASARARFAVEFEAAAALDHPNIVRVRHAGEIDDQFFLEMELVEGGTLADRLVAGPMAIRAGVEMLCRVARAVEHAHDRGVLHRDLKPGNVLLDAAGQPRLTDFGLARWLDRESDLTATSMTLGTPAYLAPEIISAGAGKATTAADVYGLGALLYECLSGHPPYRGVNPISVLNEVRNVPPPPLSRHRPGLPRDLEILVARSMAREPADRMVSARELADELERWLRGEPIRSRPVPPWEQLWAWARRRPALTLTGLAAIVTLLVGIFTTSWQWQRAESYSGQLLRELTVADLRRADLLFGGNEEREAMALLAANLRRTPTDRRAAMRSVSALTQRVWPRPAFDLGPHERDVQRVAWSPDGRFILTAQPNGVLRSWDASKNGLQAGEWQNAVGSCHWLAWSADGDWFASRTENGSTRVWATGGDPEPVLRFDPPDASITLSDFAPTGAILALVRDGKSVEVWSPTTRARRQHWVHPDRIEALGFTADGRRLSAADDQGRVRTFDVESGNELVPPLVASGPLKGISWSPDGREIALTAKTNGTVELWDWANRRMRRSFRHDGVAPAVFSPSGLLMRHVSALGGIVATRPEVLRERYRLRGVEGFYLDWWFSKNGQHAVVSRDGLDLSPYVLSTGVLITEPIRTRWTIEWAALSPDGLRVAVAAGPGQATVWDLGLSLPTAGAIVLDASHLALVFSADGRRGWSCDQTGVLREWDLRSASPIHSRSLRSGGFDRADFSADGRLVAGAKAGWGLAIFDVDRATQVQGPWALDGDVTAMAWDGNKRTLAAGTSSGHLAWFDADSGRQVGTERFAPDPNVGGGSTRIQRIQFDPAGSSLAASTYGGELAVLDRGSGGVRCRIAHPASVWSLRFSPDGRYVATACGDGVVRVWDSRSGAAVSPPMLHEGEAYDVLFTPDGLGLVSGGSDETIRVWDFSTGRQLTRIRASARPQRLAASSDGRWIGAALHERSSGVWDMETGIALAERLPMPGGANRIVVAPGDDWMALWQHGGRATLFPIPNPPDRPVPAWLPDVAEATAGIRFGVQGGMQFVAPGESIELAARLRKVEEPDPFWATVLKRFLDGAWP